MALVSEPRLVALRERLAAERADGAPFAQAWKAARAELMDGLSWHQQDIWAGVLRATRPAWRSAYYGSSSSRMDLALSELAGYAADGETRRLTPERVA